MGFAVLLSAPAYAQEPVLEPPRLEKSAPAVDPRTGEAPCVDVELELDVDRDGKVTDARVIRSGGDALDAAALESARGFGFVPAMRDGAPIAARIRYESVFEARQAEPPPVRPARAPRRPPDVAPSSTRPRPRPRQKQSERLRAPVCPERPSPRSAPWPDPSPS